MNQYQHPDHPSLNSAAQPRRRRRRRRKTASETVRAALVAHWVWLGAIIAALSAVLIATLPVQEIWVPFQWSGILGGLLVAVLFLARGLRDTYRSNRTRWVRAGCPECGDTHLRRVHRNNMDRVVGGVTGIPLHRFRCSACKWQGTRVDESYLL